MPRSKKKPKRRAQRVRSVRRDSIRHAPKSSTGWLRVLIEASLLTRLKAFARKRGSTVHKEIGNAIEGYLLELSPPDIRMLNAVLDRFKATMDKNNRTLDEVLREIAKSKPSQVPLKRFRLRLPR